MDFSFLTRPSTHLDVEQHLLYEAYARKPLNVTTAAVVAPVGGALFWQFFLPEVLIIWVAAIWLGSALGVWECRSFKKAAPQGKAIVRWRTLFTAQSALAALSWSAVPAWLLSQAGFQFSAMLVTALLAVCVIAMLSMSYIQRAMQIFTVLVLLPPALAALLTRTGAPQLVGVELLVGMVLIVLVGSELARILQKQTESQLRLQGILDNAQDAVITVDRDGKIIGWNPKAETLLGWGFQEIQGWPFDDVVEIFQPDTAQRRSVSELLGQSGSTKAGRAEMLMATRSGAQIPVEIALTRSSRGNGQVVTAFVTDISQRKEAQKELNLFHRVIDASSQCVVITDATGHGFYQNAAHKRLLGYSDSEVKGAPFTRAFPPDVAARLESEIKASMVATGRWSGPLPFQRKDGSRCLSQSSIGAVLGPQREIQYIFNIFSDLSGVLAQQEELRQAKVQAEEASLAKTQFISGMSHELRTPLNAVLGFAQVLQLDERLTKDQSDSIAQITSGGTHLLKLINEVLDLARIESGAVGLTLEPVDLGRAIAECWSLVAPLAKAQSLTFHSEIAPGLVVQADRMRLKQVLLNLLTNAIHYSPTGGDVGVRVLRWGADKLRVEVQDTGPGIEPQRLKHVFAPFDQLGDPSSPDGTHLGLSITDQLVRRMGGQVGVQSTLGAGAMFWVELAASALPDQAMTEEVGGNGVQEIAIERLLHVLCIDDNPVNLKLIRVILKRRPQLRLTTALTPGEGLNIALAQQPDLILLDINMPGMDGYQVLEVLKSYGRTKTIPVIAVTANSTPGEQAEGAAAGLDGYVTKPIDVTLLLALVDRLLRISGTA